MIWLTWRQFRPQAITAAIGLAAAAIVLAVTRPALMAADKSSGLAACHARCATVAGTFLDRVGSLDHFLYFAGVLVMYAVPALMGLFWGAPLIAREIEAGTHRIAWNQSITRTRWTFVKLALTGMAAVATAGLLSLMVSWWSGPIDHAALVGGSSTPGSTGGNGVHVTFSGFAEPRLDPAVFAARGVIPIGYAAFAFALGVTAGVLLRRTLPAMAVTFVVFVAVMAVVPNYIRPNLLPPDHFTAPVSIQHAQVNVNAANGLADIQLGAPFGKPGAWVLSDVVTTPSGGPAPDAIMTPSGPELTALPAACMPGTAGIDRAGCVNALHALRLRESVTYEPASRFWPLQWIETGIFLVLAAGLGCVCEWQVRRRRAA
jgi:hypothetical protein